jgi:hypothetical protein
MLTLKGLRQAYNFTQGELAKLFEVTTKTIQNMEVDSSNIKSAMLKKYLKAFNVAYEDVFLGAETEVTNFIEKQKNEIVGRLTK